MTGLRTMIASGCVVALIAGAAAAETKNAVPCDIQKTACNASTASGVKVVFIISPRPVRAMENLDITVQLTKKGKPVSGAAIILDLSMPGMYMGSNQPMMREGTGGSYTGQGVIPRCESGGKTWKALLGIHHGGAIEQVSFLFEVQ